MSLVQALPSSQSSRSDPTQIASLQVSVSVQTELSSHSLVFGAFIHPLTLSHPSSVQALPSLHEAIPPASHTPLLQVSAVVQALPSLQDAPSFTAIIAQVPLLVVQEFFMQDVSLLPSHETTVAGFTTHLFSLHASVPLHRLSSS